MMSRIIFVFLCLLSVLECMAQQKITDIKDIKPCMFTRSEIDEGTCFLRYLAMLGRTHYDGTTSADVSLMPAKADEEDMGDFIFDPEGEEKLYVMSLYSYDVTNQKFVNASSMKSQVRFAPDGKTVYFKDITMSLGVETWLKGEYYVQQDDSTLHDADDQTGTICVGDTVVRIPFGQPLAYYKGRYLIFFAPMLFNDKSGEMAVQKNMKLIMRNDSLTAPDYETVFQAACGYVYISEETQGFLSMDVEHRMRLESKPIISAPDDVEPVQYVYTLRNSNGRLYKKKAMVKRKGSDVYMQISTSSPNSYIHGVIDGDSISVEGGQVMNNGKFVLYYHLADPVYEGDSLVDFQPTTYTKKFAFNSETGSITSSADVYGVDYMDGLSVCMDYITEPRLDVYGGDKPVKPLVPSFVSIGLDSYFPYISFTHPALDVDSAYINPDKLYYRMYLDDELYTFEPGTYSFLGESMTDVPTSHSDSFDFYVYSELHYIYLYEDLFTTIGLQSVYKVDGKEMCSDIVTYDRDKNETSVIVVTGIDDIKSGYTKSTDGKRLEDGRLVIIKNGAKYSVAGQRIY